MVQARKALEMFRKEMGESDDDSFGVKSEEKAINGTALNGTATMNGSPKKVTEEDSKKATEEDQRTQRWQNASFRKPMISQQDDPCLL